MKIEQNRIDDLNLELSLTVTKEDYADNKKKRLNEYRRKAEFKGFRKGMVPRSLVEKMYGQNALVDSVNDIIAESLNNFIKENNLKVLGEPLPSEDTPHNEWTDGNDFNFKFDLAQNPEVSFELSASDEIPYYTINVTEAAKKDMKETILKQYGSLEEGKKAKADDFIIVDFEQGDLKVEGTYVALRSIAEVAKATFVGVKAGDVLDVNVNEAFENETDRAAMLRVSKDELAGLDPVFKMTVKNVKTFVNAPLTEETFEKAFGVKTEADTYRGLGSIDITAAVRSLLFIGKLKDSPTTRVLIHEKSSLAPPGQSLAFSLGDEKGFEWIGAYDITADELLAGTDTAKTESKTAQAQMLILELLADGKRMPSAELEKTVNERGISSRTMRTAKSRIGDRLVTEKDGTAWVCYLRD